MANPTNYFRPATLAEALKLAEQPGAIPLAGGGLALGSLTPPYETIIDVQGVPEMRRVEHHANGATFGAAVSLETVLEWSGLPAAFQRALTRAIPLNLRNNISIGESLRLWQTPILREWITTLLAHDAGVESAGADGEITWNNLIELLANQQIGGTFATALNLPALRQGHTLGAAYVARTPADAPIVNAAAFIYVDGPRVESEFVFVGGASEPPIMQVSLETLVGNPLDEANIASAVKAVAPQVDPVGDYLGSADYRREMSRVVVQRALLECMGQLG